MASFLPGNYSIEAKIDTNKHVQLSMVLNKVSSQYM